MISRLPLFTLLSIAALIAVGALSASAADPELMLIYPPDHPANAEGPPPTEDTPEWTTRVATRPAILPFLTTAAETDGAAEKPRAVCIVCPGGGYGGLAVEKEGVEPAKWLNERGVAALVLRYRCGGGANQQPVPLEDAQRAIRLVRSKAKEWSVDPNRLGVWGFSAGGHLAASTGVFGDDGDPHAADPVAAQASRPDFLILAYPVISMEMGTTHGGSRANLLGPEPADALVAKWSTDRHVDAKTPPAFLVHASDDKGVFPENSLRFYRALVIHGVPAEMHIFESGGHGFGMLRGERPCDQWPRELEPWLRGRGIIDR